MRFFSGCKIKLKEQHDKDMVQYIDVKAEALVSVLASLNDANSHRKVGTVVFFSQHSSDNYCDHFVSLVKIVF